MVCLLVIVLLSAAYILYKTNRKTAKKGGGSGKGWRSDIRGEEEVQEKRFQQAVAKLRTKEEPDFAILTAYYGEEYEIMAMLSDMTKQKYCDLYGYKFYVDNHLFRRDMTWGQKSAIRTVSIREHLQDHDWVYWTDSEVFILNPSKRLSEFVDDKHDVVMSRDWGDRQLNPGSALFKNSAITLQILDYWEEMIETREHHDDLRAFQDLIHDRPDLAARVKWVPQRELNAYPDLELKDKSYVMDPNSGHHYYQDGSFVVHIVNCLRDWNKDNVCCHGLGASYYHLFESNYNDLIDSLIYDS